MPQVSHRLSLYIKPVIFSSSVDGTSQFTTTSLPSEFVIVKTQLSLNGIDTFSNNKSNSFILINIDFLIKDSYTYNIKILIMPKSRHRKNQKQKSKARTERIKSDQRRAQKLFQEEFMKEIQKLKDRQLDIEEVEVQEKTDK